MNKRLDLFVQGWNPTCRQEKVNRRNVRRAGVAHEVKERADRTRVGLFGRPQAELEHRDRSGAENGVPKINQEFVDVFVASVRGAVGESSLVTNVAQGHVIHSHAQHFEHGGVANRLIVGDGARAAGPLTPRHVTLYLN